MCLLVTFNKYQSTYSHRIPSPKIFFIVTIDLHFSKNQEYLVFNCLIVVHLRSMIAIPLSLKAYGSTSASTTFPHNASYLFLCWRNYYYFFIIFFIRYYSLFQSEFCWLHNWVATLFYFAPFLFKFKFNFCQSPLWQAVCKERGNTHF